MKKLEVAGFTLFIIFILTSLPIEAIVLECSDTNPVIGSSVTCTCINEDGKNIGWLANSTALTNCFVFTSDCRPSVPGFTFSISSNLSGAYFFSTIASFNYSHCAEYTCRDSTDPNDKQTTTLLIDDYNLSRPAVLTEPNAHESGSITVTTSFFSLPSTKDENEIITKWYTVEKNITKPYHQETPHRRFELSKDKSCNGKPAVQLKSTLFHIEESSNFREVQFMLNIYDKDDPTNGQNKTTNNKYRIKVTTDQDCTIPCWIVIIIICVFARIYLVQVHLFGCIVGGNNFHGSNCQVCMMKATFLLLILPGLGTIYIMFLVIHEIRACLRCYRWMILSLFLALTATDIFLLVSCTTLNLKQWVHYVPFSVAYVILIFVIGVIKMCRYSRCCQKESTKVVDCIRCRNKPNCICVGCKEYYCEECFENHKHLSESTMTCADCARDGTAFKGYCSACKTFICNSCLQKHTDHHRLLKHLQHGDARESEFYCDMKHQTCKEHPSAHGYCLVCQLYLCTGCLFDHHGHALLWMPKACGATENNDRLCCYKGHTSGRNMSLKGFCQACKLYICETCIGGHRTHCQNIIMHENLDKKIFCVAQKSSEEHPSAKHFCLECKVYLCGECFVNHPHEALLSIQQNDDVDLQRWCQKCKKRRPKMAECFMFLKMSHLCAVCFELDRHPRKRTKSHDSQTQVIINHKIDCELHSDFGDGICTTADVFCLICNVYSCKACFKNHRRLNEYWIKTHKENLFTCKQCQKKGNIYPVECLNLDPFGFLCAECFEGKSAESPNCTSLQIYNSIKDDTMNTLLSEQNCQLHESPFQNGRGQTPGTVYCLVCKLYMCRDCFWGHRRLKDVWLHTQKQKYIMLQHLEGMTGQHQKWFRCCGLIPVVGMFVLCCICACNGNRVCASGQVQLLPVQQGINTDIVRKPH